MAEPRDTVRYLPAGSGVPDEAVNDPNATVYKWEFREAKHRLATSTVKDAVVSLRSDFLRELTNKMAENPGSDPDIVAADVRNALSRNVEIYGKLREDCERWFDMFTEREVDPKRMALAMQMMHIKEQQDKSSSTVEEKSREISEFFNSHFVREATPAEIAASEANQQAAKEREHSEQKTQRESQEEIAKIAARELERRKAKAKGKGER